MVVGCAVGTHGHERHYRSLIQWIHPHKNPYPPLWIIHWAPDRRKPLISLMILTLLIFSSSSLLERFLVFGLFSHFSLRVTAEFVAIVFWPCWCYYDEDPALEAHNSDSGLLSMRTKVSCKNKPRLSKNLISSNLGENPLEVSNTEMHQVSFVVRKQSPETAVAIW